MFFCNTLDLLKLYNHPELDPDMGPQQLLNKVQLDIRYYFCRRGGENIHEFKKDTFALQFDTQSHIAYVKKQKDELTKNHRESDDTMVTGFMPQLLDQNGKPHHLCPVRSFENLLAHLNPNVENLWQQPLKKKPTNSHVWFKAVPLGHNPLQTFMGKLSDICELSQHYTNHCIRVTGITNLLRTGKYNAKQVMAITGHKSLHSLAIYQRVKSDEKMMMGMTLTYALVNPQEVFQFKQINHLDHNGNIVGAPGQLQLPRPVQEAPVATQENILPEVNTPPLHALDPQHDNILPLQDALVPYQPPQPSSSHQNQPEEIDYLEFLCNEMDDPDKNRALSLAAQQVEAQLGGTNPTTSTTMSKTSMMTTNKPTLTTFTGCTFGNVGTLNIHIHKH